MKTFKIRMGRLVLVWDRINHGLNPLKGIYGRLLIGVTFKERGRRFFETEIYDVENS
jgi:hypothetical protein